MRTSHRQTDIRQKIEDDFLEEWDSRADFDEDTHIPGLMKDWEAEVLRRTRRKNS